ncbi:Protein of unknown function [Cotesia congregata]|uniref:Uncharacterized protein n=1 Tax=Cotesia congregata TaxID=51543 RepID=A0A8J2EBN8_COTCN|nr:Protein of unknown function [Cotesia congregata]
MGIYQILICSVENLIKNILREIDKFLNKNEFKIDNIVLNELTNLDLYFKNLLMKNKGVRSPFIYE